VFIKSFSKCTWSQRAAEGGRGRRRRGGGVARGGSGGVACNTAAKTEAADSEKRISEGEGQKWRIMEEPIFLNGIGKVRLASG